MQLYLIRIASLVAIALAYMLFDLFNKRNVPSIFAYATLAYGFVLTILYLDIHTILISSAIALVVLGVGYIIYKIGQLGAADVIEFAALSLIMPIQGVPLIAGAANQFGLPLMLSLLLNAGIAAVIIVPIYYLPKAKNKLKKPLGSFITRQGIFKAVLIAVAYAAFIAFAALVVHMSYIGIGIFLLLLASSCAIILFAVPITQSMVDYVTVAKFEEGDIIAFNLMGQKEIKSIRSKIGSFDRLITKGLIKRMREKGINDKLPVYKEAMPFALPIFIGLIISILLGNILLFVFVA